MINFGIDLGTTNSAIARFDKGQVSIFRNPLGQKDTLPSVVAFRKDRLLVGEKAREYLLRAPHQVAAGFKRKMGTDETYYFEGADLVKTPVELSAYVLKELKNFVHTGERVEAAVITIPASFDTVQSNATREAGHLAGFEEVVLLQEPIAASLAYANKDEADSFEEGQWLVYDLGGGTFDVALVHIRDGEMRVLDHEGDNFLGGMDLDRKVVEEIIVPYLEAAGHFHSLLKEMKSASGRYNALYHKLLHLAEEAKIQLSVAEETEIEFETPDDRGEPVEVLMPLKRSELEVLLEPMLEKTLDMMRSIMQRNALKAEDLKFVLMVGGSTYIPYIREQVARRLGIGVNTQVDPTTAVAVGAAFYAGTKARKHKSGSKTANTASQAAPPLKVKTAYQKASQEEKEYFTAIFEGDLSQLYYRITRHDGGFDTGLKALPEQIQEYLPLLKDEYNLFTLHILDAENNPLELDLPEIGIAQGRYSVVGQPLPHDICIEIDDVENQQTGLEVVFEKNSVLPLKRTLTKQITRTIAKGSDDYVVIHVLEGPGHALPAANQPIGFIQISGKELERDLVKGSDVEIVLEMSESRDLKITAYLLMTDQEFADVFTPSKRYTSRQRLIGSLTAMLHTIREEIYEAEMQGNYEAAQKMVDLEYELLELLDKSEQMAEDDVTDEKYQIEDRKRKIAQLVDAQTRDKHIIKVKNKYFQAKRNVEYVLAQYDATEADQQAFREILAQEKLYLASNSSLKIQAVIDRLNELNVRVVWRSPKYLVELFTDLAQGRRGRFMRPEDAAALINTGWKAIEDRNFDQLRICINQLWHLLPPQAREEQQKFSGGTGIG